LAPQAERSQLAVEVAPSALQPASQLALDARKDTPLALRGLKRDEFGPRFGDQRAFAPQVDRTALAGRIANDQQIIRPGPSLGWPSPGGHQRTATNERRAMRVDELPNGVATLVDRIAIFQKHTSRLGGLVKIGGLYTGPSLGRRSNAC
jgi:hypothetical protein